MCVRACVCVCVFVCVCVCLCVFVCVYRSDDRATGCLVCCAVVGCFFFVAEDDIDLKGWGKRETRRDETMESMANEWGIPRERERESVGGGGLVCVCVSSSRDDCLELAAQVVSTTRQCCKMSPRSWASDQSVPCGWPMAGVFSCVARGRFDCHAVE